jgi:hypothetical protein
VAAIQALDPRLRSHDISDPRHVNARELAQACELTRCLDDRLVEVPDTELLGQGIGIALVALRPSALRDPRDHDLLDVRAERLVQPGALKAFLEDEMPAPWDRPYRFDEECSWQDAMSIPDTGTSARQGLGVGLDREVLELASLPGNHRWRSARGVHVHPDVAFHRCLL